MAEFFNNYSPTKINSTPFFSLIVPIYNVEKYLQACIDSLLNQKECSFEIILIDDGSTDSSGIICDSYAQDLRVHVIHQKNSGLSASRNHGIREANGTYILFIDGDDYLSDLTLLSKLEQQCRTTTADVVAFGYQKIWEDSGRTTYARLHIQNDSKAVNFSTFISQHLFILSATAKAIRKDLFDKYNLNFISGTSSEDMVWCIRLALVAQSYTAIDNCAYVYRQRAGSITKTKSETRLYDLESNIETSIQIVLQVNEPAIKRALWAFVAQFMSMYLIVLSNYNSKTLEKHLNFVYNNQMLLSFGTRFREKSIWATIRLIGVRYTIFLIRCAYFIKN